MEEDVKKQVRKEIMEKVENLEDLDTLKYLNKYIELILKAEE